MALKEKVEKIAADLMNLEINTIVRDNILATKMPEPRHALLDIAKDYESKLLQIQHPDQYDKIIGERMKGVKGGRDTFKDFCTRVEQINAQAKSGTARVSRSDLWILDRIRDMSGQIAGKVFPAGSDDNDFTRAMLNERRPSPLKLDPEDIVLIRKAWEMGTEIVALQTVVQLDGDVVTRIQPGFSGDEFRTIHDIHRQSTRVAVDFWNDLILLLKDFFGTVFGKFWRS